MHDALDTHTLSLPASITRLVVLGDPHGDVIGLDEVLRRERRADTAFVSVGDNVGYADGRLSSELCGLLEDQGIPSVRGNHEAWVRDGMLKLVSDGPPQLSERAQAWLAKLPRRIKVQAAALDGLRVSVVHAVGEWSYVNVRNARNLLDTEGSQLVFCGHTHRAAIYTLDARGEVSSRRFEPTRKTPMTADLDPRTRYVVDAGSLARPTRTRGGAALERSTYAVLDLVARRVSLHALDKTPRIQALFRRLMQADLAEPYDGGSGGGGPAAPHLP
ncbi:MAG: metallophosphoesterase family protein [Planctomycetes bacterium]|nr:metallophosphoesterase family protein [Planctomycetota bacterium]